MKNKRLVRISDIAREANVSLATVDRVLHKRGNVSEATQRIVHAAMEKLASGAPTSRHLRTKRLRFSVIVPRGDGASSDVLCRNIRQQAALQGVDVDILRPEKFDPDALARTLLASGLQKYSGVLFRGMNHLKVQSALSKLEMLGIPALSLVTSVSSAGAAGAVRLVGLDNRAAGRTAGYLIGRLLPAPAQVAILWGGEMFINQEMREIGFRSIMRSQFRHLEVLDTVSGDDNPDRSFLQVQALIARYPHLGGIYNVGGGTEGVVRALKEAGKADKVVLLAHNVSRETREFLLDGSIDAIIQQDMRETAEVAIRELILSTEGIYRAIAAVPIGVVFKENIGDL